MKVNVQVVFRIILLASLSLTLFFSKGCESIEEAKAVADRFYDCVKSGEYDALTELLDHPEMEDQQFLDGWIRMLEEKKSFMGEILDYSTRSVNFSTNESGTVGFYIFHVEYENGKIFERLDFIKRPGGMKISGYLDNEHIDELEFD